MMKHFSHLNTATQLVQQYQGAEPLHHFLKAFFSSHKKFGSNDRKRISHLCYVFYRVSRAFITKVPTNKPEEIHQVILAGLFLCGKVNDDLLAAMKPAWNEMITAGTAEKARIIRGDFSAGEFSIENIFPAANELSSGIDRTAFNLSHLVQPDLFLRIRPGYRDVVQQKLNDASVQYDMLPGSSVRLASGVRIDDIVDLDREAVVQDLNSQRVGELLSGYPANPGGRIRVWDCCAASGGKSIMAKDILRNIDLTVSDVRESILVNLQKRFQKAGIANYKSFIADLSGSSPKQGLHNNKTFFPGQKVDEFDLIIADLPCTGSGTWSRSPEQLYFFKPGAIEKYSQLQRNILTNVLPHLAKTGRLLYITCSVFRKENEEIINFLVESFSLSVEKMELLKGYETKADTMFAALLSRL